MQKDHEGFSPKLRRLENLIEYIRASVAIREETRDRDFQKYIAILGIGLTTSAIMASVTGQFPITELTTATDFWSPAAWLPAGISILLSIGSGLIIGLGVWGFISWRQRG